MVLRRRDWLVCAVPAAAALLVDGYQLGKLSLWRDEAYSLESADRSVGQIFSLLHHTDVVNGTYYLLMHAVIAFLGPSATALRLPSLVATVVAAAMTAAIGRLLARRAAWPVPWLTGLLAGLFFVAAAQVTMYAQDARAYAIVTMFVTIATYLLVRATMVGTWRWWAGYAVAIALAGMFNLFSLLVVIAHGVTVLLLYVRRRGAAQPADSGLAAPVRLGRWLAAVSAAGIVLAPLAWLGFEQRGQISWLPKPDIHTVRVLFDSFAGSRPLVIPIAVLALCGLAAGVIPRSRSRAARRSPTLVTVAAPWLVLPPGILLAVSLVKPVYNIRYVLFCQPALALLCGAGLAWLGPAITAALPRSRMLAWLPSAGLVVLVGVMVIAPQRAIRLPASRPDNLRYDAAIIAAHARPTDIAFYIPWGQRVLSMGYPGPFRKLRDIALAESPVKSSTLLGTQVSLAILRHRLTHLSRVWLITSVSQRALGAVTNPVQRAELTLIHSMRLIGRWQAETDVLSLYGVR